MNMKKPKDNPQRLQADMDAHFRQAEELVRRIGKLGGEEQLAREALTYYEGFMYEAFPPERDKFNLQTLLA